MYICDDMSYVKQSFVDRGLAKAVPYMIRLDRYFTEEQKAENAAFAKKVGMPSKQWSEYCEITRQRVAEDNFAAVQALEKEYAIGQFRPDVKSYSFWFWCNDLSETVRDGRSGRDYSYVTLSMDVGHLTRNGLYFYREPKEVIFEKCKRFFEAFSTTSNQAIFQYSNEYDPDAINKAAYEVFEQIDGKWVDYCHINGKITVLKGKGSHAFVIRKKYSKGDNGLYAVSDTALVCWGIDNGLI